LVRTTDVKISLPSLKMDNDIGNRNSLPCACLPQVIKSDLKVSKEIGKGSFGKVSIATWRGTTVAVKELKGNEEDGMCPAAPEVLKALQKVRRKFPGPI
jgi:predicted Ser/Thr protein kinase